jgi:ubiquinone/menaquinone biosynthesis C-methylase UbiE
VKQWLKFCAMVGGSLIVVQLLIRIYLQIWPKVTPPICGFLLDSRFRRRYRDPMRTLAPLALRDGQVALEIGSGTGLFTLVAAQQVAPHGKLVSLELQRPMLCALIRRVRGANPENILLEQANAMALPVPDASVDAAFLIAVLPMVPDKQRVLREVWRVLKPEGLLMVSEEIVAPEYVPAYVTKRWGQRAGFMLIETYQGFWCYSVLFRKT